MSRKREIYITKLTIKKYNHYSKELYNNLNSEKNVGGFFVIFKKKINMIKKRL